MFDHPLRSALSGPVAYRPATGSSIEERVIQGRPRRLRHRAVPRAVRAAALLAFCGLLVASAVGEARGASPLPEASSGSYAPRFSRIFVIVIENQSFDDIFRKNPGAHYILDELTPASAVATRFYAPERNSPTAYFAMSSGFTYTEGDGGGRWAGKCGPTPACSATDRTVYEQLVESGRSWRIYSEDQTEPCQTTFVDKYWVGHNPAVFYPNLGPNSYTKTGDGSCLRNDLPMEAFSKDIATGSVPDYSLIVPNNCNNMHDECYPIHDRVLQGDAWLRKALEEDELVPGGLRAWAQANDTLLVVTYDEARLATDRERCCPYAATGGGGHIPTWVLGPEGKVAPGTTSDVHLSNFSILRTVEENWDLELLGHAADDATVGLDSLLVPTATRQPVIPPGEAAAPAPAEPGAATAGPDGASAGTRASGLGRGTDAGGDGERRILTAATVLESAATFLLIVVPILAILLVLRLRSPRDGQEPEADRETPDAP